jgi:hypothetical protein
MFKILYLPVYSLLLIVQLNMVSKYVEVFALSDWISFIAKCFHYHTLQPIAIHVEGLHYIDWLSCFDKEKSYQQEKVAIHYEVHLINNTIYQLWNEVG